MSSEDNGLISKIKDGIGSGVSKFFGWPDRFEGTAGKVARIGFDVMLIVAGGGMLYLTFHFMGNGVFNPSPIMKIMPLPMLAGVTGIGLSWLLEDIIPEKYHREAEKVASCLLPIFLAASGVLCIATSMQSGLGTGASMGAWWGMGLIALPLSFFAVRWAIDKMRREDITFVHRNPSHNITHDASSRDRSRHLDEIRRHSQHLYTERKDEFNTMTDQYDIL